MPRWTLVPVAPVSAGIALPEQVVTNAELCEKVDSYPQWIEEKTGIRERRFLGDDEEIATLAGEAGEDALRNAGITASEVDVLVVSCTTPDWVMPSMGAKIAAELGLSTPRIIDITQQACSSSVYGIYTASCLLQEEGLHNALVIGAEAGSRGTDPGNRTTRVFFGDAAAATVLRKTEPSEGLLGYDLGNSYSDAVSMASPAQVDRERSMQGEATSSRYLHMDGPTVWQEATTRVPKSIHEALSASGVDIHDVSGFALHQASTVLVRYIANSLGVSADRVPTTADVLGNTAAASPLTALWQLARNGRARRGDTIVIGAIGAGFFWGSLCFKLPNDIRTGE